MKELISAIVKTGGGTVFTLIFGAITTKIIAVISGTSGVGLWSVVKQIQQSGLMLGSLNGNTSLVRGMGVLRGEHKHQFMRTVMLIFFFAGLVVTSMLILFATEISAWLKDIPSSIVMLMVVPVWLGIARSYAQGCLNGYRVIGRLAKAQIVGAAIGALAAYPFSLWVKNGSPSGFVWLSAISAAAGLLTALYYLKSMDGFYANLRKSPHWELGAAREFILLAGALSITGGVGVITSMIIRAIIVRNGGLVDAGLFEASWSLGVMYITIVLGSFGTYVLPKLSSLGEKEQVLLIQRVSKLTTIISIPLVVLVVCVKPIAITIFFSQEFLPTSKIFRWMLIGDYLKMSGWIFAMVLVSNRYIRALILSSVLWDVGLLLSVWICYEFKLGLEWVGFSIMILQAFLLAFCYPYVSKRIGVSLPGRLLLVWFMGLVLIIFVSIITWELNVVNWAHLFLLLSVSCGIVYFALERQDKLAIGNSYAKLRNRL